MESNFLSNETTKIKMKHVIDRLLDDLNEYQECRISLTAYHALNLKLFPINTSFIKVRPCNVPVPLISLVAQDDWDYTISKVLHMDRDNILHYAYSFFLMDLDCSSY
jgi:hypothetical protein